MARDITPDERPTPATPGFSITLNFDGDHAGASPEAFQPMVDSMASALSAALGQVSTDVRIDVAGAPAKASPAQAGQPPALLGTEPRPRPKVRRQWGAERKRVMLSAIEPKPTSRAVWFGGALIIVTIALWITYLVSTIIGHFVDNGFTSLRFVLETVGYVTVMSFLTYSALMYLITRQGAYYRIRDHIRVPRAELDSYFSDAMPTLTVLVPSYCEDPDVVRATLMTAALQEYPHMRVVLLIDDPINPRSEADAASLAGCRALPGEMMEWLREPRERFERALYEHEHANDQGSIASRDQVRDVAAHYEWAAQWLADQADAYPRANHADEFVADEILSTLARDFHRTALALREALAEGSAVTSDRVMQLYRGLVWPFRAEITSFERKQYASLSHEANKAMNLNSYIGLMGRSFKMTQTPVGVGLTQVIRGGDLMVPDTDYVLTLDADSVLLREYCLRLVYLMEQPENSRLAISQTPYSAIRGAATRLERIAGATTDIQHILHQGMTYFHATFWVGANAVIRKTALDDICEISTVGGFEIRRYIQDNTVIEDTESSIDLLAHDWTLINYPERLSYSATPPDFGALAVQRARWANGGLLIMPKFWRYVRRQRKAGERVSWGQIAVRTNYMSSIAWASIGLVFLLVYPYDSNLLSPIILLAALPYFIAQAIDFKRLGYKRTDVLRVYGFNLILLPVNLAGVFKSLQQAAAKAKIPFARTPKVNNRTATPMIYILFAVAIIVFSFVTLWRDYLLGNWGNALFAGFNGVLTTYALAAFMGIRNSIVDVTLGLWMFIRVPAKPRRSVRKAQAQAAEQTDDWRSVLYFGASEEIDPELAHQVYAQRQPEISLLPAAAPALIPQSSRDPVVTARR
ncbi:MAG: glycosyltransferase family 2 protein [Candidatus Nanopelagicales bacterium]|nr:glycosyltransferase family 2 protein [Candidatus Nanopelagicales bacterium]